MRDFFPYRARRWSHVALLVGCGLLALVLTQILDRLWPALLEPVELWTVDLRFRFRHPLPVDENPAQAKSPSLAAIDYDDRAGRELGLGRWPWDRRVHAQVIEWLKAGGARAVMMDLLFDYPSRDPEADQRLATASSEAGNLFLPFALRTEPGASGPATQASSLFSPFLQIQVPAGVILPSASGWTAPLPELVPGVAGFGHIQRTVDSDGIMRRLPLLYRTPGGLVPALSLAAAFRHLGVDLKTVRIEPRGVDGGAGGWVLRFTPRQGGEVTIPIDARGRAWVNFAGPWGKRFLHFPYSWLVEQLQAPEGRRQLSGWFEGKSLVVANLTTGSGDQGPIPFERDFAFGEIHLHLLNMFLTRQFLRDATPREAMLLTGIPVLLITAAALAGGAALILPGFVMILAGLLLTLQRDFQTGAVLPAVQPVLSLALGLILLLAARYFIVDRERWQFLSILGSCLPPQTIRLIKQQPHKIASLLAGRRRELTILFADVRGFSTYCKQVSPAEIQEVLHDYLTAMTQVIRAHGGTLDKYMGDGVMAFFGDAEPEGGGPQAEEERVARHAGNAVRAAVAMQQQMGALNARWTGQGRESHLIRIGINTGMVAVGNLGTEYLLDYTVVGTEVNKAQRLEGTAEPGGLLLANRTYLLARQLGVFQEEVPPQAMALKGLGTESDLHPVPPDLVARLAAAAPNPRYS